MSEVELREKITIDGSEAAASRLGAVAAAAGRVAHAFHGMSEIAGSVLGLGALWKIAETVHEVDRLYQAVGRVKDITGIAAERAHSMFDMFELSGIPMESAERIMTAMTRQGAKLSDGLAGVGAGAQRLNHIMTKLGITVKSGPEDRLFAMAKAAQAGTLDIAQLMQTFAIPRGQAATMMTMLKQGPDKLKEIQQDTLHGADVIDDRTLESYRKMLQIRRELGDAWGDLIGVFYKNLIPAVTSILQVIKKGFDDIAPVAAAIGKGLSDHMAIVVSLTKTYVALLAANKVANMFASEKMGVFGRGKSLFTGAMGMMGSRAAAAGGMDYFAARAASPAAGMFDVAGGPMTRVFGSFIGKLGIIGAVVSVVVVAFEMLKNNVLGLRSAFGGSLARIGSTFRDIIVKVVGILGVLWDAIKPIVSIIAGALLIVLLGLTYVVEFLGKVIDGVAWVIVQVINALLWLINKLPGVNIDYIDLDAKAKAEDGKRGTGEAPNTTTNQDFRGSKFEITNNFPQGIDGGRVAVAFGDELARLGERRLDSGVRPLFSYR